ncbi:nucleoside triphosphate pyrophosphohydrolase [Acidiphilium sp.]|uniref:nucleoside triphosphate pyrophosphohydrolase n=1 Tax=Acidiphilium sp. TaxID=527 RepID=UPI003CFF8523
MTEPALSRLLSVMAALRDPLTGCPWDRAQDFASIAPYTVEEAYEVADAIMKNDPSALRDELGDLLFQVVYHARLAEERGWFDFDSVARGITDKMIRRHPHVFAEASSRNASTQIAAWEADKSRERAARAETGVLDGIATTLPALLRAHKLASRAARVGFDWPDAAAVLDKLDEEITELRAELPGADPDRIEDELGDLFFVMVNLARKLGRTGEAALTRANAKFERRFRGVEQALAAQGRTPEQAGLDEMERLWRAVKAAE